MHSIDFIEVSTNKAPDSCVIWLHGLGADGHDFENIVSELKLPQHLGVRFIFPHAPIQPVSINGGYPMRSWFDILGLDESATQDEPGIRKSQYSLEHLIEKMIATGIQSERIIIGGFSQGGALALHTALRFSKKLAGVIGLSTYLPIANFLETERSPLNATTPIFLAHGTQDTVLPYEFGRVSFNILQSLGYKISWHDYTIPHTVSAEEVYDLSDWIQRVL